LWSSWTPFKIHHAFNLDALLVHESHAWELIDADALALSHARHVFRICRPFERGPLDFLLDRVALLVRAWAWRVEGDERPNRLASRNVPDDIVLAILFDRENRVVLLNRHRTVRPGGKESLVRGEVDEVDARVHESLLSRPPVSTPKLDTLSMHRGKIGAFWRPLHKRLGPVLPIDHRLWRTILLVPEDTDVVGTIEHELVAAFRIAQPPAQMLFLLEFWDLWWLVVLVNPAFSSIALNVGELVDSHGMAFVERSAMKGLDSSCCLRWRLIFDESESLSLAIISQWHVDAVLLRLAHLGKTAQQKLDELFLRFFGNHRQAIDNNECVEAFFHVSLELFAKVGKVDILIEDLLLRVEVVVTWRHLESCRSSPWY